MATRAIILSLLAIVTFIISGCDFGDLTGSSGYSQKDVSYNLTCGGVECYNTDDQRTYDSGGYHSKTCDWYCGNYKGQSRKYVSIRFVKLDKWEYPYTGTDCWNLDSEYISEGICK